MSFRLSMYPIYPFTPFLLGSRGAVRVVPGLRGPRIPVVGRLGILHRYDTRGVFHHLGMAVQVAEGRALIVAGIPIVRLMVLPIVGPDAPLGVGVPGARHAPTASAEGQRPRAVPVAGQLADGIGE